ncbi:MAG TPA: hypothetical protein VLK89_04705 [Solirubrobacterales bacterium]|nr:hypothetical protein [Solirubrobacterales bacterium]
MLNERRSQTAIGLVLLTIGVAGVVLAGAREIVLRTQPHVGVNISNVDGTVQVFVECEQVEEINTGEAVALDLGRMPPDTQIYVSVSSFDRHPAWGLEISSNGRVFFEEERGYAKTPLAPTSDANAIVFARAFTAGGDRLDSTGCQEPAVVSKSDVPGYVKSHDDDEVPVAKAEESPYQPRHFPYDQIDAAGRWSLPTLAVLGAIAAIGIPPIRRRVWSHKGGLATGTLAVLGAGLFQLAALPTILILAGVLLLLTVSVLLLVGLEGTTGAGGAQG